MPVDLPRLNLSQRQALDAISVFLTRSPPVFLLKGSAGTGKTTLITQIIRVLNKQDRPVQLIAPTGRAARILGAKTGDAANTIHGCIYGKPDLQVYEAAQSPNDPGMQWFFPLKHDDPSATIFIVDESSMVGDKESKGDYLRFGSGRLLTDLIEFTRLGRIGRSCASGARIIFVGDPAQLPPVRETLSPALSKSYLKDTFDLDCEEFELTEVMRQQEGSVVLDRATAIRKAINKKVFNTFNIAEAGDEILSLSILDGVSMVENAYRSKSSSVLITYSNSQALKLNKAVRGRLWGNEEADLRPGDILLINRNSYKCDLSNGDLVKVKEVTRGPERRSIPLRGERQPVVLEFRCATIAYRAGDGSVRFIDCQLLQNLLDSPERELTPLEQRALLVDFRQRHRDLRPKTQAFNVAIREDPYFNALQVKYGYAMTCHKSQGGEWNTAVVDFGGGRGNHNENFFRWAYTAMTRAQARLVTINAPSFIATPEIWGARSPAPVSGTSRTDGPDPAAEADWNRFCFNPGQEGLFAYHLALQDAWNKEWIGIERLDHLQYLERYLLAADGRHASVQYHYKRNFKVSTITAVPGHASDPGLLELALRLMKGALAKAPADAPRLADPFLADFQTSLEQAVANTKIRIIGAEPMLYRLRVAFAESGNRTRIDFLYSDKKTWTNAQEVGGPGSTNGLIERIRGLMEGKE